MTMRLVAAAKEKLKAQRASIIMNEDGSSTVKVQEGGSISASQLPGGVEAIVSATYGDGDDIMQPTHRYRQQDCTGLFKAALGANSDRPFKVSNGALGGDIPGLVGKRKCVVIQLRPIGDDVEASAHTAAAGVEYDDCSICLDSIVDPLTLGCGHTFCRACIAELRRHGIVAQACPNCRRPLEPGPEADFEAGARQYVSVERRRSRRGLRWDDIAIGAQGADLVILLDGALELLASAAGLVANTAGPVAGAVGGLAESGAGLFLA